MSKFLTLIAAALLAVTAIASGAEAGFTVSKATVLAQAEREGPEAIEEAEVDADAEIENSSISDVGCKTFFATVGMTLSVPCNQN